MKRKHGHRHQSKKHRHPLTIEWRQLTVRGGPSERGMQHGEQLSTELRRVFYVLPFLVAKMFNIQIEEYYKICKREVSDTVKNHFPEFYEELRGICHGAASKGVHFTIDQLVAWNAFHSMFEYLNPRKHVNQRCSAFIATGDATAHGNIVMAHNTHCDMVSGSLCNIVMYVIPDKGFPFLMQTCPGFICSASDFFISSTGIVGCETTICMANYFPHFRGNYPFFCRIRNAMQYGNSLDEYAHIMITKNAGDYPCSWLFGDTRTNEIMRCELGLKITSVKRTKNGIFHGMNSAMDPQLRTLETNDRFHNNILHSQGARHKRLKQLLYKTYFGKITVAIAKRVLRDHYDMSTKTNHPSNLTVCNHSYESEPYNRPHGAQDGKVVDTNLARQMSFWGIFGSSCGKAFSVKDYVQHHPVNQEWEPYLANYPKGAWQLIKG